MRNLHAEWLAAEARLDAAMTREAAAYAATRIPSPTRMARVHWVTAQWELVIAQAAEDAAWVAYQAA